MRTGQDTNEQTESGGLSRRFLRLRLPMHPAHLCSL
uniref:Uncharacterized protein n=1 Tax=mine drainage metagenome TaxID=410659 RepID=E6PZF1_9ZZZZ